MPKEHERTVSMQLASENDPRKLQAARPVYFAGADQEARFFAGQNGFEKELLTNTLLHPVGLLLPDVFCFFPAAADHVLRSVQPSLFELGMAGGLIRVARRHPVERFTDLWEEHLKGRVVGLDARGALLAARYDRVRETGECFRWTEWPSDMVSERFAFRLSSALQRGVNEAKADLSHFADVMSDFSAIWDATAPWRFDLLDRALDLRRKRSERETGLIEEGIRRGELLNLLAASYLPVGVRTVGSINDLLPLIPDRTTKSNVKIFWKWIVEAYEINQAVSFGAVPCFSHFTPLSNIMVPQFQSGGVGPASEHHLRVEMRLPIARALQRASPSALLEARRQYGHGFFAALNAWTLAPEDPERKRDVRTEAERYGRAVCGAIAPSDLVDLAGEFLPRVSERRFRILTAAIGSAAVAGATLYEPNSGFLIALAGGGVAVWSTMRSQARPLSLRAAASYGGVRIDLPDQTPL